MQPVFYIAEAITFSTSEIAFILLILATVLVALAVLLIYGYKRLFRLGASRSPAVPAAVGVIVLLDIAVTLFLVLSGFFYIVVLPAAHIVAFWMGRASADRPVDRSGDNDTTAQS